MVENAKRLPSEVTGLCQMFFDLIAGLSERINELTRQLRQVARQNDAARRLMTIPGIGPEFIAEAVRNWIKAVGAKTAYIKPGSPWENGYCESFNGRQDKARQNIEDGAT